MTLDEGIKHEEKVVEKNEKIASWFSVKEGNPNYDNCVERAEEHRQIAEWLRELKRLREQTNPERKPGKWVENKWGEETCSECGYTHKAEGSNFCPNCGAKMEVEKNE